VTAEVGTTSGTQAIGGGSTDHLGTAFKAAYGTGQCVESLANVLLNTFLFFYLTNVCGLSGSLTGLALFLALGVDAIADPLIGAFSDGLTTRYGRRLPVMTISLLPIALAMGFLFSLPQWHPATELFLYVLLLLVVLRVSLSGFIIPFMGLGAELSDDYDERSSVVAFRTAFGIAITLIGYILGFQVFLGGSSGLMSRAGYGSLGFSCGAIVFVAGALAIFSTRNAHSPKPQRPSAQEDVPFLKQLVEVIGNSSFRQLFTGVLLFFIGQGVWLTLSLHANTYFWHLSAAQIQTLSFATVGGLIAALPLAFYLIGRTEKRSLVLGCVAVMSLAEALPVLLAQFNIFEVQGAVARMALLLGAAVIGGATTLATIAFQSAMADALDEHEVMFAARREGLYFASLSFASKAAIGLGSLISGTLLQLIAFPSQELAAGQRVVIAPHILDALGIAYGPFAALITAASLISFARYRLDRTRHAQFQRQLRGPF
jgi:GPH family glycoside/pentoside/hexuronide:cation symporter